MIGRRCHENQICGGCNAVLVCGRYSLRDVWLDPDVNDFDTIRDILKPYDPKLMRRYPVSRKLNNSKIDDAEAASPVTLDTPTQGQLF